MDIAKRESHRKAVAKYRATHPEQKIKQRHYDRQRYVNCPKVKRDTRARNVLRDYGITLDEYEVRLGLQGDKCAICKKVFIESPHLDHDHIGGILREFLCGLCNKGLGQFHDDSVLLKAAAEYLRRYGK